MRMRCIGPRSVLAETNFPELTNKTNHIVHSTNAHCTFLDPVGSLVSSLWVVVGHTFSKLVNFECVGMCCV